jgi:hypothetical protein
MKKIIISIGVNEKENKGELNMFVDEQNRGIDYWNKNKEWMFFEIEVPEKIYSTLHPKVNQLLNYNSGYNVTTILKAFQELNDKHEKLLAEVKK